MAGGNWEKQNKTLPGFYLNIKSAVTRAINFGSSGTAAICESLSWGPVAQILTIDDATDVFRTLGYDLDESAQMRFLREIFLGSVNADGSARSSGAAKVLLYRPAAADAAAAEATVGGITATARYPGVRGNSVSVAVSADPDQAGAFLVTTYVSGSKEDEQTVTDISALTANDWVSFSGSGAPTAASVTALTGGADGTVSASAYASFLTALEPERFDVVIYDGTDATVSAAMTSFVKRLRDREGRKVRAVMPGYAQADFEGVTSPVNGIVLKDGVTLTAAQSCWWVGGCAAGADYNQDMTYAVHPGAAGVSPKYTNAQAAALISAGNLVFFEDEGNVRVFYDINTLTSFTAEKTRTFSKNRPIRTLDYLANSLYRIFADFHVGQTDNDADGRNLVKKEIVKLLNAMQASHAVKNFTADDVSVVPGEDSDAIAVDLAVQPVDAISKIYMTVTVS